MMRSTCCLLFAALGAASAQNAVRVPDLGPVYDEPSAGIRLILGIPGAAVLSPSVDCGFPIGKRALSAKNRSLIAASADDGNVRAVTLDAAGRCEAAVIPGAMVSPDRLVLSPSGTAAVLFSEAASRMQVVSGLPDRPSIVREAPAILPVDFSVSDDGRFVLALIGEPESRTVWSLGPDTGWVALSLPPSISAITFVPGSEQAAALSSAGEVFRIRPDSGTSFAGQFDSATGAFALRMSPDGEQAFTAATSGVLSRLDLTGATASAVNCSCKPVGLDALNRAGLYRITNASDRPVVLLDAAGTGLRTLFVPAYSASREATR